MKKGGRFDCQRSTNDYC